MPAPAAIVVIVNSSAGTAAKRERIEVELADLFRAAGTTAEVIALERGQDPAAVARDASARASIVVAAGGDGTVSSVAAAVVDSPAALGVLPLGTLNHFAKDLHIPLDLADAIRVVAAGHIGHVDVGQVNDRVFVNNSSIGLYPSIVEEREALRRRGHRKWPAMALATVRVAQEVSRRDGERRHRRPAAHLADAVRLHRQQRVRHRRSTGGRQDAAR